MSVRQFAEWRAYADLEPFDEVRQDLRIASIVQTLANIHRRKGLAAIPLAACVLKFTSGDEEERPKTPEQARAAIRKTMDFLMEIYNKPPETKRAKRVRRSE